jgi:sugar phosphate isomerase/epimerase
MEHFIVFKKSKLVQCESTIVNIEIKSRNTVKKNRSILFASTLICGIFLTAISGFTTPIPDDCKIGGFAIGCQAWTFNNYTVMEAIDKTAAAGGKIIEFYPGQKLSPEQPGVKFDHNSPDDVVAQVQAHLKECRVRAVNYGVVNIPNDEAGARKVFEFAKKLGVYGITTEAVGSLDTIEKLVKEYDIRVGFHDHDRQPSNPDYKMWDPNYVLSVIKNRDPRIGACADTGHWVRSGLKPVDCLKILNGHIISVHLHDMNQMSARSHDVPAGAGVTDVPAVLDELKRQNFDGNISIEFEYNWKNNVTDAAQCIGFLRGYEVAK